VLPIVLPDFVKLNGESYMTITSIRTDFNNDKLSETALKEYLTDFLNGILGTIQRSVLTDEMRKILELGYPKTYDNIEKLAEKVTGSLNIEDNALIEGSDRVVNAHYLKEKLSQGMKLKVGFRISGKGRFHLGYLKPLLTLRRLSQAGHECVILISDLDSFLDNEKCAFATMEARCSFLQRMLEVTMNHLGGFENVKFVQTKNFEYTKDYSLDMYKMASNVTRDASGLVKGGFLASHLIPIYFALDHHYAGIDLAIMGEDMEKDYVVEEENKLGFPALAAQLCEAIGYKPFASLLVPTLLGMNGVKMGSADAENHLEPFDTTKQTNKKIAKSFCEPGNLEGNIALHLTKVLLFPHFLNEKGLSISRTEENGGNLEVMNYEELEALFKSHNLHPADLKSAVNREINAIFDPVRKELEKEQKNLLSAAFPVKKGGKKK